MNFKKISLILLLLCILTLNAVSASDNNYTITDGENNPESAVGENTFTYVQKAVDNAKDNDVVELEGVYTGNITIQSNKSITLEGVNGGATFDGSYSNNEDGIFMAFSDDDENNTKTVSVTLKNLNFINYSAGYSAVSAWDNVNLKVINCSFINCNSNKNIDDWLRGGAIGCVNKYSEIIGCKFINCSSESGGAISMSSEEYMIDACDFINCTADAGGAVYLGSKGTVKNTNFINNHANADGGVLYGEICEVNLDNCNFKNNIAGGFGAVIYAYSYNGERNDHDYYSENYHLTVTNSKFTKNIALNKTNILTVLENNQCKASNDIFIYGDDPQIYTENSTKIKFTTPKIKATLKAVKLSTEYNSGKKFKVTLTDSEGTGLGYIDLAVKVYTGKKSTTYYLTTDYGGVVAFDDASLLSLGVHKVVVSVISDEITASKKTSSIKISKSSPAVKAPKVTNDYKKSKYFKVTVKSNKKPVKNIKLKVKVFNGKKYNIHTIKTNKKGIAKLNTKSLSKGTHKVIISSGNKNYKISAKSSIKIK